MTVTISRLYDTYTGAQKAVQGLEAAGVPHSDIRMQLDRVTDFYSAALEQAWREYLAQCTWADFARTAASAL